MTQFQISIFLLLGKIERSPRRNFLELVSVSCDILNSTQDHLKQRNFFKRHTWKAVHYMRLDLWRTRASVMFIIDKLIWLIERRGFIDHHTVPMLIRIQIWTKVRWWWGWRRWRWRIWRRWRTRWCNRTLWQIKTLIVSGHRRCRLIVVCIARLEFFTCLWLLKHWFV